MAFGQEAPDQVVVLVAEGEVRAADLGHPQPAHDHLHRVSHRPFGALHGHLLRGILSEQVAQPAQLVGVVPVHPHAQADGLLRLQRCVREHALLAQVDELRDAVALDVVLAGETELALDQHLDPQTLAVEAVLVTLVLPEHRVEALVNVLVRPAPGVVHAHRVVRSYGSVEERPALVGGVLRPQQRERVALAPRSENLVLERRQIRLPRDRLKRALHPRVHGHRASRE